jgi:hypothetical protein
LDDNIAADSQVVELLSLLATMFDKAMSELYSNPTGIVVRDYLACAFSFDGNASRPDLTNNATLSEYRSWQTVYDFVTVNGTLDVVSPQFRVIKKIVEFVIYLFVYTC